jgi:hypothetical protein
MSGIEDAVKKFAHDLQSGPWEDDLKQLGKDLWDAITSDDEKAAAAAPAEEAPPTPPAG